MNGFNQPEKSTPAAYPFGVTVQLYVRQWCLNRGLGTFLEMHKANRKLSDKICNILLTYIENEHWMWVPGEQVRPEMLSFMNMTPEMLMEMKPEHRQAFLEHAERLKRAVVDAPTAS